MKKSESFSGILPKSQELQATQQLLKTDQYRHMKKALWIQLQQRQAPNINLDLSAEQELLDYKRQRLRRSIAARTSERAAQEQVYYARVKDWLRLPENRWCRVYHLLLGQKVPATQCHHYQGRRGMLLLYEPFWFPVSWEGHRWIDEHRQRARELGLLCPLGRYNSPVQLGF